MTTEAEGVGMKKRITSSVVCILGVFAMLAMLASPILADQLQDAETALSQGDFVQAIELFRSLAEQGDALAQTPLGLMYEYGQGVPQDYKEALKWYRLAAEQGDAFGQHALGLMYGRGNGVPQDFKEAIKWFQLAAKQGLPFSQHLLGGMYARGQGVPQDYKEALKWFRLAAEQGDRDAEFALGHMYVEGNGVPQNYKEASKWYRLAAEQGQIEARVALGFMYEEGKGVPQDYKEATKWFRLAAEQGDAFGQLKLSQKFAQGKGVPQDYVQAHLWANLAASSGLQQAERLRDRLVSLMTATQLAEAQALASEWQPQADSSEPKAIAGSATGFFVDANGTVITSQHVVAGASRITARCGKGEAVAATVAASNQSTDIAVLATNTSNTPYLTFARPRSTTVGQRIFTYGFPVTEMLGAEPKFTDGTISALSGIGGEQTYFQISVPVQPGNSGGPVVNDDGEVVGIVAAVAAIQAFFENTGTLPQNVNWAVKAEYAAPMFDSPPARPPAKSREEAIQRVERSLCFIEVR